jgi:RNA polymerase sigma-70 factor (ECF subfamily)
MIPSTNEIWEEFNQELHRFIARRVSNVDDVDDLLQDIFIKIHTRIGTLADSERLAPWLYTIARNTLTDYYRQHQQPQELNDHSAVVEDTASFDDDVAPELAAGLHNIIDSLPEGYRQAIELSEIQGVKQQAVADQLGISLSGAKSRVQRGRQMLRRQLLDCCHFEFDRLNHPIDYAPRPEYCQRCCK